MQQPPFDPEALAAAFAPFREQAERTRAALEQAARALGETLTPVFRAFAAFAERHPELVEQAWQAGPAAPVQACHCLCPQLPGHVCEGDATDTLVYDLGPDRVAVPVCGACWAARMNAVIDQ